MSQGAQAQYAERYAVCRTHAHHIGDDISGDLHGIEREAQQPDEQGEIDAATQEAMNPA